MVREHEKQRKQEEKEASLLLQLGCLAGLIGYGYVAITENKEPNVYIIIALAAGFLGVTGLERIIGAVGKVLGRR